MQLNLFQWSKYLALTSQNKWNFKKITNKYFEKLIWFEYFHKIKLVNIFLINQLRI